MRRVWLAFLVLVVSACAGPQRAPVAPETLLRDDVFARWPVTAESDVLAASAAMRNYLRGNLASQLRQFGPLRGLVAALENNFQLKLEYEASVTRTAAEAFEARAGNCLSLTLMTAALARELGLSVSFQRVFTESVWSRQEDLLVHSGHVNVVLEPSILGDGRNANRRTGIIVDFLPGVEIRGQRSQEISERTVIAMYMNNRAVEALGRGAVDEAYWWAREAVLKDPWLLEAVNSLAVIYSRHGFLADAARVLRYALSMEPDNVTALANLAGVLERQGQRVAALEVRERLRRLERFPPFHYYDAGLAALKRRDFEAARALFQREVDRDAAYHGVYFGLAIAYLGLGEADLAQRHLETALKTSTNRRDHDLYAAKMAWLLANGAK